MRWSIPEARSVFTRGAKAILPPRPVPGRGGSALGAWPRFQRCCTPAQPLLPYVHSVEVFMKTHLRFWAVLLALGFETTMVLGQHAVDSRMFRMGREQFERRRINPAPVEPVMAVETNAFVPNGLWNTNAPGGTVGGFTNGLSNPGQGNLAGAASVATNRLHTNALIAARPTYLTITNNGRVMPVVVLPNRPGTNVQPVSTSSGGTPGVNAQIRPVPSAQPSPAPLQTQKPPPTQTPEQ